MLAVFGWRAQRKFGTPRNLGLVSLLSTPKGLMSLGCTSNRPLKGLRRVKRPCFTGMDSLFVAAGLPRSRVPNRARCRPIYLQSGALVSDGFRRCFWPRGRVPDSAVSLICDPGRRICACAVRFLCDRAHAFSRKRRSAVKPLEFQV